MDRDSGARTKFQPTACTAHARNARTITSTSYSSSMPSAGGSKRPMSDERTGGVITQRTAAQQPAA